MKQLVIDETRARKLYPTADANFKGILEDTFTQAFFSQKITDRISSWEDICEINGIDINHPIFFHGEPDEIAYCKLKEIVKAYNQGWTPNWNDGNQRKWFPWFYLNAPGFRLHALVCPLDVFVYGHRLPALLFQRRKRQGRCKQIPVHL